MSTKINLESIYDDFAMQALFYDYVKDSIEDVSDYDSKSEANATVFMFKSSDLAAFSSDLLSVYELSHQDALEAIKHNSKSQAVYYAIIDYPSMLRDDLINGYLVLIENNNKYYVMLKPQAYGNANILNQELSLNLKWLWSQKLVSFKDIK